MGLAPYGSPSHMPAMRKIVKLTKVGSFIIDLAYFRHHRERIAYSWESGAPEFADLFSSALKDLLGPRRRCG
jgi:carbamoyltransferase